MAKLRFKVNPIAVLLIVLGLGLIISYFMFFGGGGFIGHGYKIKCTVAVKNPIIGSAYFQDVSCIKTETSVCTYSAIQSIISSSYNIKFTANTGATKTSTFSLYGIPTGNTATKEFSWCSNEDANSLTVQLYNKEDLKDTTTVSI